VASEAEGRSTVSTPYVVDLLMTGTYRDPNWKGRLAANWG
jgi:hypothetical protein